MPTIKINHPGLKLREKSRVHRSIIDSKTGRRKTDVVVGWPIEQINNKKIELWPSDAHEMYKNTKAYISYDLKKYNLKKKVDVLVLGPGTGEEVVFIKKQLGKKSNVDTLGLTNYLSKEANKVKRKDYSPKVLNEKTTFEHFNHLGLVEKYDYIFSRLGPGMHTFYPEIVLLKVASILRPGGFARIYCNPVDLGYINEYLNKKDLQDKVKFKQFTDYVLIKRLK